jgi:multiple sugar transport system ATP-binding protein
MSEITLEGVTKVFADGQEAVKDMDLEIGDGEFMILVGPSGCGKSTALRMIAGLEDVSHGEVKIGGDVVNDRPPKDRDIAMVFQNYALYPHMTVRENMGFALKLAGVDKEEIDRKVEDAAKTLDLEQHLDRRPANLSGGQRQRVAMGRAIVRDPKAFLMDEPLSNLDAKLRVQMRTEVARLQSRLETTTVYVTHDQVEAMTLGDRVAVLRDGVVQQCDVPQVLFRRPCNLFVAAFIGSPAMNLVPARLQGGVARFAEHEIPLPSASPLRGASREVILGVRPTAFAFDGPRAELDWPRIDVAVELVEELGDEVQLTFQIDAPPVEAEAVRAAADAADADEGRLLLDDRHTRFTASFDGRRAVHPGERVRLALDARDLHFFDPVTTEALAQDAVPEAQRTRS